MADSANPNQTDQFDQVLHSLQKETFSLSKNTVKLTLSMSHLSLASTILGSVTQETVQRVCIKGSFFLSNHFLCISLGDLLDKIDRK